MLLYFILLDPLPTPYHLPVMTGDYSSLSSFSADLYLSVSFGIHLSTLIEIQMILYWLLHYLHSLYCSRFPPALPERVACRTVVWARFQCPK